MWKIQKYRIAQGLTQENLAERVDLSVSYISEIEKWEETPLPENVGEDSGRA